MDELILYWNVRSLNGNFENMEVLIERMKIKPFFIVCSETWKQKHCFYNLPGYRMYYNFSEINLADGVVVYIKDDICEETITVEIRNQNYKYLYYNEWW